MDRKERTDKENKAIGILAKKLRRTLLIQQPIAIGNKLHVRFRLKGWLDSR